MGTTRNAWRQEALHQEENPIARRWMYGLKRRTRNRGKPEASAVVHRGAREFIAKREVPKCSDFDALSGFSAPPISAAGWSATLAELAGRIHTFEQRHEIDALDPDELDAAGRLK